MCLQLNNITVLCGSGCKGAKTNELEKVAPSSSREVWQAGEGYLCVLTHPLGTA
jgi:hypothetical protein